MCGDYHGTLCDATGSHGGETVIGFFIVHACSGGSSEMMEYLRAHLDLEQAFQVLTTQQPKMANNATFVLWGQWVEEERQWRQRAVLMDCVKTPQGAGAPRKI